MHDGDDGGAPGSPPLTPRGGGGGAPADGVWLENRTGDIFRHDLNERAWVPIGNVGLHCSFGSLSGAAHARSEINRSDGVGTAEIAVLARHHPIFAGVNHPPKLVVSQRNQWHSHLSGGAADTPLGAEPDAERHRTCTGTRSRSAPVHVSARIERKV